MRLSRCVGIAAGAEEPFILGDKEEFLSASRTGPIGEMGPLLVLLAPVAIVEAVLRDVDEHPAACGARNDLLWGVSPAMMTVAACVRLEVGELRTAGGATRHLTGLELQEFPI